MYTLPEVVLASETDVALVLVWMEFIPASGKKEKRM